MKLYFDLEHVTVTEFGVGRDDGTGETFAAVPVDTQVQAALRVMALTTWEGMQDGDVAPAKYEPTEKYGSTEYVYLPLDDDLASSVRQLHDATNLAPHRGALDDPADVFCYFAKLRDKQGRHLTALRRATQFKGIVKSRLIRFVSDALKLIDDRVFKLDTDFDLLIDSANVHIWRPSGFEFAGNLQQAILEAVPENVSEIQRDLPFVDFGLLKDYAAEHPRAARYLASIRGQAQTRNVDKSYLKRACKQTGVDIVEARGKIIVSDGHEMGFLEVLDRRRYQLELVRGQPECFRAGSRTKLNG